MIDQFIVTDDGTSTWQRKRLATAIDIIHESFSEHLKQKKDEVEAK